MQVVYHMGLLDVLDILELVLQSNSYKCKYDLWAHWMSYNLEAKALDFQEYHDNSAIGIDKKIKINLRILKNQNLNHKITQSMKSIILIVYVSNFFVRTNLSTHAIT